MTRADVGLVNDSLERCSASDRFLMRFYELFLASAPEVAEKFKLTEMRKQSRLLKASLYFMMLAAEGRPEGSGHLDQIAERHGRKALDIRPGLYDLWLDSLIQAVREFDPRFTPEIEKAWRVMMKGGIDFMRSRY